MFKLFLICLVIALVRGAPTSDIFLNTTNARQPRHIYLRNDIEKSCNCVCGANTRQQRVVGGEEAKPHEFPWLASLSFRGEFYCGASLITRKHLLTAAHCIKGFDLSKVKVTLADHDRNAQERSNEIVERNVVGAKTHVGFDIHNFNNDIAILEMDRPVDFSNNIQPACLPLNAGTDYTSRIGIVAGWGRLDERKKPATTLRKVAVPIWSKENCLNAGYQQKKITGNMFCAGYAEGKRDACQGDSGGPLHVSNDAGYMEIVGLVSWGRGCGRPNFPGVYTQVINYLDWVDESLDGECVCPPPTYTSKHV